MINSSSRARKLGEALRLGSGLVLKNRLGKASTSESLADADHEPSAAVARLYARYAESGVGLVITGNVMVDRRYLERPQNVVVEDDRHLPALKRWAQTASAHGTAVLMQLNHAGRQANRLITSEPAGPSAGAAVNIGGAYARPRALGSGEIHDIVARFARAAQVAQRAGFAGVEVDAAHGYLLSQFLSPLVNLRSDEWGGTLERRARLLRDVVRAVREATGRSFTLAVKLNSADFQRGGFDEADSLEVVRWLTQDGVDLLEISGGSYEQPALLGLAGSTRSREAYFLDFARRLRAYTRIPLMVTGGFRSRSLMESALEEDALDLIGLARPVLLEPDLPQRLLLGQAERSLAGPLKSLPRALEALYESGFYDAQMQRLARQQSPAPSLSPYRAIGGFVLRDLVAGLVRYARRGWPGNVVCGPRRGGAA